MDEQFEIFDGHDLHAVARRQRSAAIRLTCLRAVGWLVQLVLRRNRSLASERRQAAAGHGC
ncbi:hypothetical protein [Sinorhizobium alkalisoli]|uniref:hypothetical protein n=1 Tax=Sinorhizobium alkalisoli TaxID=1752398 RepID=UPI00124F29A3|nr:hypothetical protein [Sinorhizobium alkalisoli]MCA1490869.1 hypothetical protein [Ensifer sp. NBAIM29]QFI67181.1 hypothetical protein EKH55_2307 [Sinorhizobium alkalisoli]